MRFRQPTISCDGADGECGTVVEDYHTQGVDSVTPYGQPTFRITSEAPAPGWVSSRDGDFCPTHALVTEEPARGSLVKDKHGHTWVRSTGNGKWHCRGCQAGNMRWSRVVELYGPITIADIGGA